MEKFVLTHQSQPDIEAYVAGHFIRPVDKEILAENGAAIASADQERLT